LQYLQIALGAVVIIVVWCMTVNDQ